MEITSHTIAALVWVLSCAALVLGYPVATPETFGASIYEVDAWKWLSVLSAGHILVAFGRLQWLGRAIVLPIYGGLIPGGMWYDSSENLVIMLASFGWFLQLCAAWWHDRSRAQWTSGSS